MLPLFVQLDIAGLASDDAADVVAHVLIAHGAGVHAGADETPEEKPAMPPVSV